MSIHGKIDPFIKDIGIFAVVGAVSSAVLENKCAAGGIFLPSFHAISQSIEWAGRKVSFIIDKSKDPFAFELVKLILSGLAAKKIGDYAGFKLSPVTSIALAFIHSYIIIISQANSMKNR